MALKGRLYHVGSYRNTRQISRLQDGDDEVTTFAIERKTLMV